MNLLWPVLLVLGRGLYGVYALWCGLFPWALAAGWCLALAVWADALPPGWHWVADGLGAVTLLGLALGVLVWIEVRTRAAASTVTPPTPHAVTAGAPSPEQRSFLAWFGTLKAVTNRDAAPAVGYTLPSAYLVENPGAYRLGGAQVRAVLACLQPGDILLRGYLGYLDGVFIRRSGLSLDQGLRPGWFTHAAVYVGEVDEADAALVPVTVRADASLFSPGPQRVVHAMARGVHTEDILTFLRCDTLCVLRLPEVLGPNGAPSAWPLPADPGPGDADAAALARALAAGTPVRRAQAVAALRAAVLNKIGHAYDFDCSDTTRFHRFSCAELVYYGLRGVLAALDLRPRAHALYPLPGLWPRWRVMERVTLTPDDFDDLVAQGALTRVWQDPLSASRPTAPAPTAWPPTPS